MDWTAVISAIAGIFGGSSVVYLLLDKKVSSPKDKVETVGNAIPLYKEIRSIVAEEVNKATQPLKEELEFAKTHYYCYRMTCEQKIRSLEDIARIDPEEYGND